jgi:hypothetical protein
MSEQSPQLAELVACGRIDGTGAVPPLASGAGFFQRGCVVTRPGAAHTGVFTVTLDRPLSLDAEVIIVEGETADLSHRVVDTSDTAKSLRFRTVAAIPAAEDSVFNFSVWRVAGGGGATGR